jgi:hypothetical protein
MRGVSDKEMRRRTARALYEIETEFREDGWPSDFVYDVEQDLYRFADGEFASLGSTPTSGACVRWALLGNGSQLLETLTFSQRTKGSGSKCR